MEASHIMKKTIRIVLTFLLPLLVLPLLLSGCANRPFLNSDNTYAIVTDDLKGNSHELPLDLSWNTNQAVLRQLLVEASFVLTELRSHPTEPAQTGQQSQSQSQSSDVSATLDHRTYLQATFPDSKQLTFLVDGLNVTVSVQAIEIEVEGPEPGQVILNHAWVLQGIANPNLDPAYQKLVEMLDLNSFSSIK